tara:strand:+ start:40 stop:528 length:489 start_codon:yes stop_codon:yes gene_type:complete
MTNNIEIGLIMGSDSDWATMKEAAEIMDTMGVSYEKKVISAHRTPDYMTEYAKSALLRGLKVIIAGAGGAAHLPGMIASHTILPVIGVPIQTSALGGLDSLYSIVQMPNGIPVATVAIGKAQNAGLLACRILANSSNEIQNRLQEFHKNMAEQSFKKSNNLN